MYIYIYICMLHICIKINIGGKHSISHRTTFSPNCHLEEMQPGFLSRHIDMVRTELHSHILLKGAKYYISLESVCYLFFCLMP